MNKRQFKSQASSGRAADAVGGSFGGFGVAGFGSSRTSTLSYIQEPSDFSTISDANIVVVLKNLSKKDGTTKAKALEDLQAHIVSMESEPEDALLEAWVKHFPRLSIDSERRVRQLAYNVNGVILLRSGKRAAKHMPRIVGPWLAGTADSDRAAANAADGALRTVFPSVEKLRNLRKAYHGPLLEYANEAILHESAQTLSDERTVSKEDAEATYARVVATCLYLVQTNLDMLSTEELSKQHQNYEDLLGDKRVWDFVIYSEVGVRRSMHRMVSSFLTKMPSALEPHLKAASSAYVYKGLPSDQTGSATDLVKTLSLLTTQYPAVWEEAYTGKKTAVSRLTKLLQRGSQVSANYWEALPNLLEAIPDASLGKAGDEDILQQMRDGLKRREERNVLSAAWRAYFIFANRMSSLLPTEEDRTKLMEASVIPAVWQFLYRAPETAGFAVHAGKASSIVAQAAHVKGFLDTLERQLPDLSNKLIETAKMSQPEQAKDFTNSQDSVAATGLRWAELQRDILATVPERGSRVQSRYVTCDTHIVQEMFELLKTRNGKPYGAAATVDVLLQSCQQWLMSDPAFSTLVVEFAKGSLPAMLDGPSQRHLIAILYATSEAPDFEATCRTILDQLTANDSATLETNFGLIKALFTPDTPQRALQIARDDQKFQELVQSRLMIDVMGSGLSAQLISIGVVSVLSTQKVLSQLAQALANTQIAGEALTEIEAIAKSSPQSLQQQPTGSDDRSQQLLPPLLQLEQSDNDSIASRAHAISLRLTSAPDTPVNANRFQIVVDQLDSVHAGSMKIAAVIELALRLIGSDPTSDILSQMLPSLEGWYMSLDDVTFAPKQSLAILSPLSGALSIVEDTKGSKNVPYDADGYSKPLRMAIYVTALLKTTDASTKFAQHTYARILNLLALTKLVAEDNISIAGTNAVFGSKSLDSEAEVLDFITEAERIGTTDEVVKAHFNACDSNTPLAYYNAIAYAKARDNTLETTGFSVAQAKSNEEVFKDFYRGHSNGQLPVLAFLRGNQQTLAGSQVISRILNELVADLTDANFVADEHNSLCKLLVLNSILSIGGLDALAAVANQRLVFLARSLVRKLSEQASATIKLEVVRALTRLISGVKDVYGDHWASMLSFVSETWYAIRPMDQSSSPLEHSILLINVTIRLYGALRKLASSDEPNDDLVDALGEHRTQAGQGLINVLTSVSSLSDEAHQPLSITNEMLAREIAQLPADTSLQPDELYPLMYTASRAVQEAALALLRNHIFVTQEQISFDAALENKSARLPDELLSLVLEAPTLELLADASFERTMPLFLQGYLFSWRLIFDHFTKSSYKVKSDYIEQIKSEGHLPQLLDLVFDFLGHTRGKPVDVSKFDLVEYRADEEVVPEKDVQWLLAHLYYLSLMHLPSLVKSYFLEIRSRQTVQAIEAWTAKHISPLLIASSLQSVAEWAEKSVKDDPEYEKMTVKVGMRSKEVTASYLVDEQTMAIKVILPEVYPLASAQVVGISRVAVKEEKWQSWLRNCQGVITFSNGSIIDGLSAWRRNVVGALKGQTECAICYSIISGDKQLPTKKCPTCKHLFHNSCLFKWFKTSNANTCPLCRNAFQFN